MLGAVVVAEVFLIREMRLTRHAIRDAVAGLRSSVLAAILLHSIAVVAPRLADWASRKSPHKTE